jgi:hypothetical protein
MSIYGEPHWRLSVVAKKLGLSRRQARLMFAGRPGVVTLTSQITFKTYILIPERVFRERVWTAAGMAELYGLPLDFINQVFEGEAGTFRGAQTDSQKKGELLIPESVRARVFRERSAP